LVTPTDSVFLVGDGTNWVGEIGATARTSLGVGTADNVRFATMGLGIAAIAGYSLSFAQVANDQGMLIYAADKGTLLAHMYGNASNSFLIASAAGLVLSSGSTVGISAAAGANIDLTYGGLLRFLDVDAASAVRGSINSATGELAIASDTVGLKLGAAGGQTLYSNGTNFMFSGGDIDANGSTIFFGVAENVATPAVGNSNIVTINLGAENHHTLDCATSATGAVTANVTVPPGPCGGTIVVKLGSVAITWVLSAGTAKWMDTQPTWETVGDDGKYCIVSWRWDGTFLFLSPTGIVA
jgi:hypothetical protein